MKRLLLVAFAFAAGFAAHTFADTQPQSVTARTGEAVHVQPNAVHRGLADPVQGVKLVAVRFKPKNQPLVMLIQR